MYINFKLYLPANLIHSYGFMNVTKFNQNVHCLVTERYDQSDVLLQFVQSYMCHLRILVNCKSFFNLSPLSVKVVQTIYIVYYRVCTMYNVLYTEYLK